MKAILIIDYASEEDIGEKTSIHLINKNNEWVEDVVIKPIPEKKVVTVKRIEDIQSCSITEVADKISAKIILKTNEVFAFGWNACLDFIIGENNGNDIDGKIKESTR